MLVSMGQKNTYALVYNNDQSLVVKKKILCWLWLFPIYSKKLEDQTTCPGMGKTALLQTTSWGPTKKCYVTFDG